MRLFGYTVVKVNALRAIKISLGSYIKGEEARTRMIANLLATNDKLSKDRCLWCGRTREGALREVKTPKGAGVAV